MPGRISTLLATPDGFASREAARFVWQLDDQRAHLTEDTRGLAPAELEWQPAPGQNTIGMLLAHIAFAEVHLTQVGLLGEPAGHVADVIGITEADEGLPLPAGAPASSALAGRPLEYFDDLLRRSREYSRSVARRLTDADLAGIVIRPPRPDGTVREFDRAWVLYHLVEHEAGHRGQINLLRHQLRDRK